jgi:hypothetical protein
VFTPRGYGSSGFGRLAEDEADKDVDTADGEEEEGCNEGKGVNVMGEDRSANAEKDVRNGKGEIKAKRTGIA